MNKRNFLSILLLSPILSFFGRNKEIPNLKTKTGEKIHTRFGYIRYSLQDNNKWEQKIEIKYILNSLNKNPENALKLFIKEMDYQNLWGKCGHIRFEPAIITNRSLKLSNNYTCPEMAGIYGAKLERENFLTYL